MIEIPITSSLVRRKTKTHTRKQLHRQHEAARREAKALKKVDYARQNDRSTTRTLGVFEGCDPKRTLALIGEEY